MSRMPYPDSSKLTPEVRKMLMDRLPLNFYKMLGHAPAIMPGWFTLGRGILYEASLDPKLRELAILRVGHLSGCNYEIHQHERVAASVGLPGEKIADTKLGANAPIYDTQEKLILAFTDCVVRNVKADDELFRRVTEAIGYEKTLELMVTIGFYMMAARIMENTGIELEEGGGPSVEETIRLRAQVATLIAGEKK